MKSLLKMIDCLAVTVAVLIVFVFVVIAVKAAVIGVWRFVHDLWTTAHGTDWWLIVGISFSLIWSAFRWRAGMDEIEDDQRQL